VEFVIPQRFLPHRKGVKLCEGVDARIRKFFQKKKGARIMSGSRAGCSEYYKTGDGPVDKSKEGEAGIMWWCGEF